MSFYYIAIDDGCMARLEMTWNLILGFNLRDFSGVLCFYGEATIFQMLYPATAATSAR